MFDHCARCTPTERAFKITMAVRSFALEREEQVALAHIAQAPASLAALSRAVHDQSPFQLAAFHDLVALSGSLVLALAVTRGRLPSEEAWRLSRIDEDWQIEVWGEDEEAADAAAIKHAAFLRAGRFYGLCG